MVSPIQKTQNIPLWRQIQKKNFTRIEPLLAYLELSEEQKGEIFLKPTFPLNLPERLAAKIEKKSLIDPIFRQFVPLRSEGEEVPGFVLDPVQDKHFQKTKKILHKYPGRALLLTSSACAMHCRFCFRQNFPYETEERGFEEEIRYLQNDPTLSELILSGGDPLSLSDEMLRALFSQLETIPHLKRIRFHSRFPVGIPERIDLSFLDLLRSSTKQIYFIAHINHPRELDQEVISALKKIIRLGIPVLNQSVLLKGINDEEEIYFTLCETLLNSGITPYYLHLFDPIQGGAHFAASLERGRALIEYVQSHLSGFGVPRFAQEIPGKPSKTFI